jgi:ActR/RegA family two-component response regulator
MNCPSRREALPLDVEVLLVDPEPGSRAATARALQMPRVHLQAVADREEALHIVRVREIHLFVTELRLDEDRRAGIRLAVAAKRIQPHMHTVILTSYGAVSSAVAAIRAGVDGFLTQPVTGQQLLATLNPDGAVEEEPDCMSLEQAKWEYINRVVDSSASLATAARRLGLDRRSLRRMLSKYAPVRPRDPLLVPHD